MDNYFMLDGKKIPMSDETADSLREKQIYSIGDCFKMEKCGTLVMLAICESGPTNNKVVPVCLNNGNWWSYPKVVEDTHAITSKELHSILAFYNDCYTPVTLKIEEII